MKPFARSGDFWSGLVLAALGAWIFFQARGWVYLNDEGPGAGFFPRWYGALMVLLSLLLVLGAVLKPAQAAAPVQWRDISRALLCWAAFAASVALMPLLGFGISFALLAWFIVKVMCAQSQRAALAVAIGGAASFDLLFARALELPLPRGLLGL